MISRENIDRVRAAASFSFLPPIPSFLPNAFWQWQQWQRPHGWLVMWALEWRRPAFGSSGTHGRLLYIDYNRLEQRAILTLDPETNPPWTLFGASTPPEDE